MKAQWKKTPLEQAKARPMTKLEQVTAQLYHERERNHRLQQNLYLAEHRMTEYEKLWHAAEKQVGEEVIAAHRYRALRKRGVLVEENGRFNFYEGADLDDFVRREVDRQFDAATSGAFSSYLARRVSPTPNTWISTPWQPHPKHW